MVSYIPKKTGLILFTHNNASVKRPLSFVSSVINLFQTGRLKNRDHIPTHTAVTLVINNKLYAFDVDNDGCEPELFEVWKRNRAWICVFDPNILGPMTTAAFINKALEQSGKRYGFEDIRYWLKQQLTGVFDGEDCIDRADDTMICSYLTGFLYDYKNWWKRGPKSLWDKRLEDAPDGVDVCAGVPDEIVVNF